MTERLSWNSPDEALRHASEEELSRIYDEYVTFVVDRSGDSGGRCYFCLLRRVEGRHQGPARRRRARCAAVGRRRLTRARGSPVTRASAVDLSAMYPRFFITRLTARHRG